MIKSTKSVSDVANLIESLIPEKEKRNVCLHVFLESIKRANQQGSNKWGVHFADEGEKIRLLVGSLIVLTMANGSLWITLDKELLLQDKEKTAFLDNSNEWQWDRGAYGEYKKVSSRNGYYNPWSGTIELWKQIEELHLSYIDKVAKKYFWLHSSSQPKHVPQILFYLRQEMKQFVPEPQYSAPEAVFAEEVEDDFYYEGTKKTITVNAYERDQKARQKCIKHWKTRCFVCDFSFEDLYGEIGKGFIHVHHLKPLSEIGKEYELDPIKDLVPVCPNCHAMLHKRKPPYSIQELKDQLK